LVSQQKSSKTCTNKGPETKFPEIFDELFARANKHNKVSMTNETVTPIKLAKAFVTKKQLTKFSHLHEQIRFATENLLVCIGLNGLYNVTGRHLNIQNNWNQFNYKPFGGLCMT